MHCAPILRKCISTAHETSFAWTYFIRPLHFAGVQVLANLKPRWIFNILQKQLDVELWFLSCAKNISLNGYKMAVPKKSVICEGNPRNENVFIRQVKEMVKRFPLKPIWLNKKQPKEAKRRETHNKKTHNTNFHFSAWHYLFPRDLLVKSEIPFYSLCYVCRWKIMETAFCQFSVWNI